MNVSWVLADNIILDPLADLPTMKEIGPLWGSWKTWRACSTDNVICHDQKKVVELIKRDFHKSCNFYIPNNTWVDLGRPDPVRLYEGKFIDEFQPEEIIGMHLAAGSSDIVLLLGFDLSQKEKNPDKMVEHRAQAYRSLILHAIQDNPEIQWVLVDHPDPIMKMLETLPNLTQDTMVNALELKNI